MAYRKKEKSMSNIVIMGLPTIALLLLKSGLSSLDKINRVSKMMLFVNIFNLTMLFFTPFDADAWLNYLIFLTLFIGLQKEVFIEAKQKFFDFMVEHDGEFLFTPTKIDEKDIKGVLTLPNNKNFAVSAKYVGTGKLEENTKYEGVKVYLAVGNSGDVTKVFCSN